MPPCAVRGKSFSSSLREVFGNGGNVAQKLRRGFQVPVGGIDVDVPHVRSQSKHVLPDALTAGWRCLQCPDRKRVTEVMNTWPSTAKMVSARLISEEFETGCEQIGRASCR